MMNKVKRTKDTYSFLWGETKNDALPFRWHFNDLQDLIPESIIRGKIGIDIGSGCGYDTYLMAQKEPSVKIISLEISDGIFRGKEITAGLKNVLCIKGSATEIPIKDNMLDFIYSFGVLHHVSDTQKSMEEVSRIAKHGALACFYLYEDHSGNFTKSMAIRLTTVLRKITVRIPPKALHIFSYIASPFALILFSYPSRILRKFNPDSRLANGMPFNFGTHPFSLAGDIYDRFSVPIERRFKKEEALELLEKNGFINVKIGKIPSKAGWVVWGYKNVQE